MTASVVCSLLILAMAAYSDADYCVCNSGLSDPVLQKDIDYACGAGADCTQIQQNGACYNPNTVKSHCDYAVNSYYQRRSQAVGSCNFSGTATPTSTNPSTVSTCVFPASPSNAGTPISGTPTSGGTPSTGTGTPTVGGTPSTGTPTTGGLPTPTGGSTFPGGTGTGTASPTFGLGPTGSTGFPSTDSSAGVKPVAHNMPFSILSVSAILSLCFIRRKI